MKVKIGSTVTARVFSGERVTGKIESIEICAIGSKYGRSVKSCDLSKHKKGTLCLDCGKWCYFDQVSKVN